MRRLAAEELYTETVVVHGSFDRRSRWCRRLGATARLDYEEGGVFTGCSLVPQRPFGSDGSWVANRGSDAVVLGFAWLRWRSGWMLAKYGWNLLRFTYGGGRYRFERGAVRGCELGGEREIPSGVCGQFSYLDNQGNESGYGSDPGYRGDAELGYDDEEDDDPRVLFWGDEIGVLVKGAVQAAMVMSYTTNSNHHKPHPGASHRESVESRRILRVSGITGNIHMLWRRSGRKTALAAGCWPGEDMSLTLIASLRGFFPRI
ncbi:hypothetical protein CASFOL_001718 [Castilleja foliolosa]|uniref:Uncharacterized protein n=1 Tax=Castilleja foliolosa TaxID=1961234 RepID=A0ABD3ECM0_9LAMI